MTDESTLPSIEESSLSSPSDSHPVSKSRKSRFMGYSALLLFSLVLGILIILSYKHYFEEGNFQANAHELLKLKNQITFLEGRLQALHDKQETLSRASMSPASNQELENKFAELAQTVQKIESYYKSLGTSPVQEQSQAFAKELSDFKEQQCLLISRALLDYLKTQVMTGLPFQAELTAFRNSLKKQENLSLLEKYAAQGLQILKPSPVDSSQPSSYKGTSWWMLLREKMASLITIKRQGSTASSHLNHSADYQTIESVFIQLDQALAEQLVSLMLSEGEPAS